MRMIAQRTWHGRGRRTPALPRAGFSIFELVTVLGIMAVIAALAAPRFSATSTRYRAELAAKKLATDLAGARQHARAWSTPVTFTIDTAAHAYSATPMPDPVTGAASLAVTLGREPWRATVAACDFEGGKVVVFDSLGTPDVSGSVTLAVGTRRYRVTLDASGNTVVDRLAEVEK